MMTTTLIALAAVVFILALYRRIAAADRAEEELERRRVEHAMGVTQGPE